MRSSDVPSRLATVVAIRHSDDDRLFSDVAEGLLRQYEGRETLEGTWIFPSSAGAVVAAHELLSLSKQPLIATVFTGEVQATGPMRGVLSERALAACEAIKRPGVYTCIATRSTAADTLPPDLWLIDAGVVAVERGGVERLCVLLRGSESEEGIHLGATRNPIPRPQQSFTGRKTELGEIVDLLSESFLVTLTGLPGCGKSALAAEVARQLEDEMNGGIYWVDADCLCSREDLLQELHVSTWPGKARNAEPLRVLADRIKDWPALLVFDNCEHLLDEVREIVSALLKNTTSLSVLVTSTTALRLPREHAIFVSNLEFPELPEHEFAALNVSDYDALNLFDARAAEAQPEFELITKNVGLVAGIIRELNGHPLAIEIAAAKVATRSLSTIARQAKSPLGLRNELPLRKHHQSLKHAFAHLLGLTPRELVNFLFELTVLESPFTYEQVVSVWPARATDHSIANELDQLVRRSLLSFDRAAGAYVLDPLLRKYLELRPEFATHSRPAKLELCRRMIEIGATVRELFAAQKEKEALDILDAHYKDVEQALRVGWTLPEIHRELPELLLSLPQYWTRRHLLPDAERLIQPVLDNVPLTLSQESDCWVYLGVSRMYQHDFPKAEMFLLRGITLAEEAKNDAALLRGIGNLGINFAEQENYHEAADCLERALVLAESDGDSRRIMSILSNISDIIIRWVRKDPQLPDISDRLNRSEECLNRIDEINGEKDELLWKQSVLFGRGDLHVARGDLVEAERNIVRAAHVCDRGGMPAEAAMGLERLAEIRVARALYREAAKMVGLALSIRVGIEIPRRPREQARFDSTEKKLLTSLGSRTYAELCNYGASISIADIEVLP